MNSIEQLQKIVDESSNIVFFGGAGVSTESGIPDFRSVDGLYNQKYDYPPEEILSHTFFEKHTDFFYRFYKEASPPASSHNYGRRPRRIRSRQRKPNAGSARNRAYIFCRAALYFKAGPRHYNDRRNTRPRNRRHRNKGKPYGALGA